MLTDPPTAVEPDSVRLDPLHSMNPFRLFARTGAWSRVGLASEFPDISVNEEDSQVLPACKAFNVPKTGDTTAVEADINLPGELKDQVLVFQNKGKFHAIDHVCEHSKFQGF